MKSQGVDRFNLIQYHADHHTRDTDDEFDDDPEDDDDYGSFGDEMSGDGERKFKLSDYVTNLNERATDGKIDPMIGRSKELDRMIHILCRRRKNNPILVGEAGVGKTAIAEGLALAIVEDRVPEPLQESIIYSLEISSLVAGTRYRGDFEERVKKILKHLKEEPNAVVFIDEIHTFIGAGAVNGGALDASSIFKPMLARGELRCIGATTWKEYRTVFMKDQAFARRFQKVEIDEPSHPEAIEILQGLKSAYEEFHQVTYTDEAIEEAVTLSSRYFHDRYLPDKAIDVIDEAGAEARLKKSEEVDKSRVESTIARMASIPSQEVSKDDKEQLRSLEPSLKSAVFGQDEAVGQLVSAIKLARAGLGSPEQPIGAFMFTGPTGVGKTEVARQLAHSLSLDLIRFDMSEYMERHTVSRLIGAPPGYVGFDQGGLLTDAVTKKPHCVLLLDEIEKAHPEVFNILLQVMDHGTLTDNNGRKADFRNVILIMTSNVGAKDAQRNRPGFFADPTARLGDDAEAFKRTFSPEFRNRLHARVRFAALSPEVCLLVARKQCGEVIGQLRARDVELRFSQDSVRTISKLGYDPLNGARPMQRILREKVKRLLADELLFGQLAEGGEVFIEASDEWITYLAEQDTRDADSEGMTTSRTRDIIPKVEAPLIAIYNDEATSHQGWDDAFAVKLPVESPPNDELEEAEPKETEPKETEPKETEPKEAELEEVEPDETEH
jgi:ATP-dependent Clp protease ATP-binding subunit ClpA